MRTYLRALRGTTFPLPHRASTQRQAPADRKLAHGYLSRALWICDAAASLVSDDLAIREAATRHCRMLSLTWGEAVPWAELARGFPYGDGRTKLVGPQGVFKPKELTDGPLTLLSTLASTYEDEHLDGDEVLLRLRSAVARARKRGAQEDRSAGTCGNPPQAGEGETEARVHGVRPGGAPRLR